MQEMQKLCRITNTASVSFLYENTIKIKSKIIDQGWKTVKIKMHACEESQHAPGLFTLVFFNCWEVMHTASIDFKS